MLGASGAGKSVVAQARFSDCCRPDSGTDPRPRAAHRSRCPSASSCACAANIGMLFQESALFDSLTVAENVGYRLSEEIQLPADAGAQRASRRSWGSSASPNTSTAMTVRAVRRSAPPRRHRARDGRQARACCCSTTRRPVSIRSSPRRSTTRSSSCAICEQVTSIVVTHQIRDAVLRRDSRSGAANGALTVEEVDPESDERVEFLVLRDGRIHFVGTREELLAASDDYLKEFLFMTLPPW